MEALAKRLEKVKNRLKRVDHTRIVTADGRELIETRSAEGRFVQSQVSVRPWAGVIGDVKPDLQVAEILSDQLYMGSQDVAQDLPLLSATGITHIVNIATGIDNFFESNFVYLKISILDLPCSNLKKHFEDCSRFIHEAVSDSGKVFVHCNAGISRSSTVVIAYLIEYERKSLKDAMEHVRSVRSCVRPNEGFMRQLEEFEAELSFKS